MLLTMLSVVAVLLAAVTPASGQTASTGRSTSPQRSLVTEFCIGCHNERLKRGELVLSELDVTRPDPDNPVWEKIIRKVRTGMMPPVGARRPDAARIDAFASALEAALDGAAAARPNPGRPTLHRLNRTEYANSVRDLLGLEIDVTQLLPADDMSRGFDNMADVLTISPTLMDGYIRAAGVIGRLAVGDPAIAPRVETYQVPQIFSQTEYVEGTPMGTRGGIAVRHFFPADGEYAFKLTLHHQNNGTLVGTFQRDEQIEVAIDGERIALLDIDPKMLATADLRTPPIKISAGPKLLSASFINRAQGPVLDVVMKFETAVIHKLEAPGVTVLPHLNTLGVSGPYNVTGPGDTPSRRKIFACRPNPRQAGELCARKIVSALARQAYRRPVVRTDVNYLMRLYKGSDQSNRNFETGVRLALQGILADPEFVFRFERTPANVRPESAYRIGDLELASRLSFFLWSSGPDETLLNLAARGKLRDPGVIEEQVRRLIADDRAEALAKNFASQWLHLRNLRDLSLDSRHYPNADQNLMRSMERETELFFMSIVREDRNITDLLTADYTFIDGRLARHYKIPNVVGNKFRRVTVTEEARRGLLGHASILTVTSYPTRTSPVLRGKWVLDNLLGAPPAQPPPDVPALKENTQDTKPVPLRVRLQEHRANPSCAACHATMDPIGFALENRDAVGASRIYDSGERIDASGQLPDGTKLDGPAGLRKILFSRADLFATAFTEKLLTYALGRGVESHDMPFVRSVTRTAALKNNRFSAFVLGIVNSVPFQMRRAEESRSPAETNELTRGAAAH